MTDFKKSDRAIKERKKGYILSDQITQERKHYDTLISGMEIYVEEIPNNAIKLEKRVKLRAGVINIGFVEIPGVKCGERVDVIIIPRKRD